jgi:DNA repair protein RadC
MKILYWPKHECPREKLLALGAVALSDSELLAILLRTGIKGLYVIDLTRNLLAELGSLRGLLGASKHDFCHTKGLGQAKFAQLQAILEISQR